MPQSTSGVPAGTATTTPQRPPAGSVEHGRRTRRWWALAALTLSVLVVALDSYVLVTALPTLSHTLGASTSQLQWITAGYTLASAGLLLPAGKAGDRLGRRTMLLVGLAVFGVASIIASQVGTATALIVMRVLMGIGGAIIMPMALAVLPETFPEPADRQRAVTVTAMGTMLGLPLGPLLAGWLLDHFAWGSIFLINGPIVVLSIVGVALFVPESKDPAAPRVDWIGSLLVAAGVAGLVYGMIEQPVDGWSLPILAALAGGAILLGGFVVQQLHTSSPLVDLRLFGNRGFTGGSVAFAVLSFALSGVLFVLTPFLQVVQGNDAQGTGLRLLTMIGAMLAGAALSEKVFAARVKARILIPSGMLVGAAGLAVLKFVHAGSGYGIVALALAIFGFGLGLALPLAVDTVLASLPAGQTGVGNAMSRTVQGIGVAFGTAILGSVLNNAYRGHLTGTLPALPNPIRTGAEASVAGAHTVAGRLPSGLGQTVASAADQAYAHGMAQAALISIGVLIATALCVVALLPRDQSHAR